MKPDQIIDLLGGYKELCKLLNVNKSAISNYKKRGKFPSYTIPIIMNELKDDLSRNLMAELIFDELEVNKTMAIDCLIRIEQSMIQTQLNNLREKLKTNDSMELVQKITELQKNRNDIKKKYLDV